MGNPELVAVVLALQEWRHWLEGAVQPLVIRSDHKNLTYIRSTCRLISRQAQWALFLTWFDFSITYRPDSQNVKPDTLSHQFAPVSEDIRYENIIPPTCMVGAACWRVEQEVQEALFLRVVRLTAYLSHRTFGPLCWFGVTPPRRLAIQAFSGPSPSFSKVSVGLQWFLTPGYLSQLALSVQVLPPCSC